VSTPLSMSLYNVGSDEGDFGKLRIFNARVTADNLA